MFWQCCVRFLFKLNICCLLFVYWERCKDFGPLNDVLWKKNSPNRNLKELLSMVGLLTNSFKSSLKTKYLKKDYFLTKEGSISKVLITIDRLFVDRRFAWYFRQGNIMDEVTKYDCLEKMGASISDPVIWILYDVGQWMKSSHFATWASFQLTIAFRKENLFESNYDSLSISRLYIQLNVDLFPRIIFLTFQTIGNNKGRVTQFLET